MAPEPVLELAAQEPKKVASAASSSDGSAKNAAKVASTIRVDSEKVDRLINLMGEMVISQSMLSMQIDESEIGNSSPTALALVELQNLTRDIQSSVMAIRAQPIKPVFMRMSRVVREVCASTGKRANLILEGENTEVDTTVIEGLIDPLTHMIRNSVDHGIEESDIRLERGKSEVGNITLSASHSSGSIIIEIKDDGAGINREKLKDSAIQKGIISADAKLSDDEIDNLIFAPGFSTSEKVTDVSGRGVGMDVVRQSIQSLGGRVNIASVPEKGSHFTLHLPLTLAILEGMLVQCCEQVLVLPVTSVLETMVLKPQDIHAIGKNQRVFKLRKDLVPIVDVGFELGFVPKRSEFTQGTVVVVESGKNNMCAFVVDSIVGQQQVVIKSMESNYRRIPSIAAATILGSGRIALILDVDEIVNRNSLEGAGPAALDLIA
ncbi:MAG: chemotaxis protein CheA [Rhizobiaceae bacterium]|nr:chemotaxis protein CheA [Rhizobiaceae bacterium]